MNSTPPSHSVLAMTTRGSSFCYIHIYLIIICFRGNGKDIRKILDEEEENHNKSKLSPEEVPKILGR